MDDTIDPGLFNGSWYRIPPSREAVMSALLRGEPPPQLQPGFNRPPLVPDNTPLSANMPSSSPGNPAQPQAMPQAMPRPVAQPTGGQYVQRPTSPLDTSDIEARNAELGRQRAAAEQAAAEASKPPDASALEALGQKRNEAGARALVLALAAQRAGENFQPITQAMLKKSDEYGQPMKMTGGQLTSEGWAADPGYMQQMAIKGHEARIARIDQALQQNLQMAERRRLELEKEQSQAALRDAMLGVQTAIAQQGSLDRRYAADLASQDRQAALDAKAQAAGKGTVPPQAILDLATEARKYLPQATSSGAGALVDQGAAFFGKSTPGAQAAARLNAIAGQLTMSQPRLEGPQSDKDTMLYRQMAGDVGNATLPVATRLAALDTITQIAKKYQTGEYTPPIPQRGQNPPGWYLPRATSAAPAPAASGTVDFSSLPK